jgi:methyl-accepting chemotaxis protein
VQLAGVPIHSPDTDRIVGGLILGIDLERYLQDYKQQSDNTEAKQHRLTLVYDGEVVASVMPREIWPELAEKVLPENWEQIREGDRTRTLIALEQGYYDFYSDDLEGFAGLQAGKVGTLYLMRSRPNVGRGATFPWTEAAIGLALSFAVAWMLALWITRPIKKFVRQSERMLEGKADLRQRIEIGSRDEVQDLAENINLAFARLYNLANDVQQASFHVGASSAEISAASKQMLGGLKDQTLKIEGSTAAVTELSASIQQVAANAVEATKAAQKSNVAVTSAVERMAQIREAVEDSAGKIHELGESGKRIGNIVEVIRQISEQTSLLALNASIEAAHAGEQGRGFAVVADEVSSLARRVGQSAKDIEALIQTIKEQTAEAVQSMQVGTTEVESGTRLVTATLEDLKLLIDAVTDTAAAVQEQAVVSDEIARNMDAVQKIATEMLSGSEEAVVQGEQLHELAFGLEQSVGGFNLDASGGGPRRPALPK